MKVTMRAIRSRCPVMSRSGCALLAPVLFLCSGCSWFGGAAMTPEQEVAEGRALYDANGCATCHGPEGRGDGPVAKAARSSPRDFQDAGAFVNGNEVEQIAKTLQTGLVQGNQTMPSYGHLSSSERQLLAVFVRSLRTDVKKEQQ